MEALKQALRKVAYQGALALARLAPGSEPRRFKAAVLKLDRLGDAVLALGAVRRLVEHFGEEETLLIISPYAADLYHQEFPRCPQVVLPAFCGKWWPDAVNFLFGHAALLKGLRVDVLTCLRHQPSDYLRLITRLVRPGSCHASRWLEAGWERTVLSHPHGVEVDYPGLGGEGCRELEAHRRVTSSATGRELTLQDVQPDLRGPHPAGGGALMICPITGDAMRQYPHALLAKALRLIVEKHALPLEFCLPPGVDPVPWGQALRHEGLACARWHQPADVGELIQTLSRSRAFLCPDSAPAHLATALDKPGVFLLGGGHRGMFAPWSRSKRQVWLGHRMECEQCRWNCPHPAPYCITRITPEDVAGAMDSVLEVTQAPGGVAAA